MPFTLALPSHNASKNCLYRGSAKPIGKASQCSRESEHLQLVPSFLFKKFADFDIDRTNSKRY